MPVDSQIPLPMELHTVYSQRISRLLSLYCRLLEISEGDYRVTRLQQCITGGREGGTSQDGEGQDELSGDHSANMLEKCLLRLESLNADSGKR